MSFKKKISAALIGMFAAIIAVFTFLWYNPGNVKAATPDPATTSGKVNIWYKTYKEADYEFITNFEANNGMSYSQMKQEVDRYNLVLTKQGAAKATQYWDGTNAEVSKVPPSGYNTKFAYAGTIDKDFTYEDEETLDEVTVHVTGLKLTPEQAQALVNKYENLPETTTFSTGENFVLLVYMQYNALNNTQIQFNQTFGGFVKDSTKTSGKIDSSKIIAPILDGSSANNYTGAYGQNGTTNLIAIGFGFTDANHGVSDTVLIGGLHLQVDPSAASKDYYIGLEKCQKTVADTTTAGSGKKQITSDTVYNDWYVETKQKITVKSATNVGSAKVEIDTDASDTTKLSYSATETSTGNTYSTLKYDLWTVADIYSGTADSSAAKLTIKSSATNAYITHMSGVQTSEAAAMQHVNDNTISGDITEVDVNITPKIGDTYYVAAEINGSYYVFKYTRKAYTDNGLTSLVFNSTDGTPSTIDLLNMSGAATTFSPGTTSYQVAIAAGTKSINFTAGFDTTKAVTAFVGTTAITNNTPGSYYTSSSAIANGTVFKISTTSQSGVNKDYTITVKVLSTDNSLTVVPVTTGLTVTPPASPGDKYVISGLKYADQSFIYKLTNSNNAQIFVDGGTTDVRGTNLTYNIPNTGGFAEINNGDYDINVTVKSEAGSTASYKVTFSRPKANEDATIDTVTAKYTDSTGDHNLTLTYDPTTQTYTATTDVPFADSNGTTNANYSVTAAAKQATSTVEIDSKAAAKQTSTQSVAFGASYLKVNSSCKIIITAENTGKTETYYVKVSRVAADTNKNIELVKNSSSVDWIYGVDRSNNTVYGYSATGDPVTSSTGYVTSFADFFGFSMDAGGNVINTTNLPTSLKAIKFKVKSVSSTTKISITDPNNTTPTDGNDKEYTLVLDFKVGTPSTTVASMTVTAQDTSTSGPTFSAKIDSISNSSYIDEIYIESVSDSTTNNTYNFTSDRSVDLYSYQIAKEKGTQYKMNITPESSKAKLYYADSKMKFAGGPDATTFQGIPFTNGSIFSVKNFGTSDRLYIYVVAESGYPDASIYEVNVTFTDTRETDNEIADIIIYGIDNYNVQTELSHAFVKGTSTIPAITIDYSIVSLKFDVTLSGSKATLTKGTNGTVASHSVPTGVASKTQTYTFQATAENGIAGMAYVVDITRKAGETGAGITSLTLNTKNYDLIDSTGTNYVFRVDRNTSSANLALTVSNKATFSVQTPDGSTSIASPIAVSGLIPGNYQIVNISVTSEKNLIDGGGSKNYTVYIINGEDGKDVDNISILEVDENGSDLLDSNGDTYTFTNSSTSSFTMSYAAKQPYILVDHSTNQFAEIENDGATPIVSTDPTSDTTKKIKVTSYSEYAKILRTINVFKNSVPSSAKAVYEITFKRLKASSVKTLEELEFIFNGGSYTPTIPTTYTGEANITPISSTGLKFENLQSIPSVTIKYKKTDSKSKVDNVTDADPLATDGKGYTTEPLSLASNTSSSVTLRVVAEDGTSTSFTFWFAYSTVTLDDVYSTKKITLEGDVDSGDILGFLPSTPTYSVTLAGKNTYAKITVTPDSPKASVTIEGNSYTLGDTYKVYLAEGEKKDVKVITTAQDGANHSEYTISVTRASMDTDNTAKSITQSTSTDGTTFTTPVGVKGFTAAGENYTINVTNDVTHIKLIPTLNNSTTEKILSNDAADDAPLELNVGTNNAQIVIESESGVKKTYKFVITRDDSVEIDSLELTKVGDTTNLVDLADKSSYTKPVVEYTSEKVNLSFILKADLANVTLTTKLNGKDLATTTTNEDIGNSKMADVTRAELPLNVGSNTLTINVAAKSSYATLYTFKITRSEGNSSNYIVTYVKEDGAEYAGKFVDATIDNQTIKVLSNTDTIKYILPKTYLNTTFNPTITVSSGTLTTTFVDGYEIVEANRVLEKVGPNTFTINLYAENNDVRKYNVVVYINDSYENVEFQNIIGNLSLTDANNANYLDYAPTKQSYTGNKPIPFTINDGKLTVTLKSAFATSKLKLDGVEMPNNNGTYEINVNLESSKFTNGSKKLVLTMESEYYQYNKVASETRTVYIDLTKAEANRDTQLKELTLTVGSKTFELIYTNSTGSINYISPSSNVKVSGNDFIIYKLGESFVSYALKAVPNVAYPLTSISGATYNSDKSYATTSKTLEANTYSTSTEITVYDEEGKNPTTYNIYLYVEEPVTAEDNNSIINIEVKTVDKIYLDKDHGFSEANTSYKLGSAALEAISYGKNKVYTISAGIVQGALTKVYIDGSLNASMSKLVSIAYPTELSTVSYVRAEDTERDSYYSVQIASGVTSANYKSFYLYDSDVEKYISCTLYSSYIDGATYYTITKADKSLVNSSNYASYLVVDQDYVNIHTVQGESYNSVKGKIYTVLVVSKAAALDTSLSELKVDDVQVSGFSPKVDSYKVEYGYDNHDDARILVTASDPNAKVKVYNTATKQSADGNGVENTFALNEGENNFSITVTAEDGETAKTYALLIVRDYKSPELKNLVLENEKMYDASLKYEQKYEKGINVYYSKVSYNTVAVNITATLEEGNENYVITPSSNVTALNKTGLIRTYTVLPQIGANRYTLNLSSNVGKQTLYIINITRSEKITSSTEIDSVNVKVDTKDGYNNLLNTLVNPRDNKPFNNINTLAKDLLSANSGEISFGTYLVPNEQTLLDDSVITIITEAEKANEPGSKVEIINGDGLKTGENTIIVKITSADSSQTRTLLVDVYRAPYEYDIKIDEIPEFDHTNILEDGYTVAADIEKLNIKVTDKNPATNKIVEHKLISGETLDFGENDVILQVTSYVTDEKGSKIVDNVETFTFKVNRENYDFTVLIEEIESFKDDYKAKEVSSRVPYEVDADATKLNVEAFIEKDNVSTDLEYELVINNKITNLLNFGTNEVTLVVKLPDGKTEKPVSFKVNRPQYDLTVAKDEKELLSANLVLTVRQGEKEAQLIPSTENGIEIKSSPQYLADITVPSNVTKIGAEVLKVSGMDNAKVKILTEGYLPLKTSVVEFEIVSEDGATTKHYSVLVTRNPMKYDVVTPDPLFELAKDNNREGYYTLKLDTKPATIIDDYLKAIKFNPNQDDLLVEVLSEVTADTNEVILKVTNNQNPSEVEFVHLNIETTATNSGSLFDILFWIILGISIILLIIILICVNRDKYGSVSKNRKRA